MITLLFIVLAAVMNACMDTIAHHRNVSVFQKLPEPWRTYMLRDWKARYVLNDPRTGTFKTYRFLGIPVRANWLDSVHDGWHLCKTLMSICMAPVFYESITGTWWGDFILYGIAWNITFVTFYDKLLR